jgi:hypothetical protein
MATPYAFEPVCTPPPNMHQPRSFLPLQVQPLHWSINALYNTIPFSGSMDSYDYFSATTNLPSKSYAPHYTQPQPQQPQYFQPPVTQEINLFDVNAFAALSPSSVGSLTITPSLSPSTIPLPTDTPENPYMRPSHPIPPPPLHLKPPPPVHKRPCLRLIVASDVVANKKSRNLRRNSFLHPNDAVVNARTAPWRFPLFPLLFQGSSVPLLQSPLNLLTLTYP